MAFDNFDQSWQSYLPDLNDPKLVKGSCGKIAIVGGSQDYTGAPYYASITPLRLGADLSFVYTHRDAASVIKGFSPDLIVHPGFDMDIIARRMPVFDGLTFGPGLGREGYCTGVYQELMNLVKQKPQLPVVIDADGLHFVNSGLNYVKNVPNIILTPNHREFDRLWSAVFPTTKQSTKIGENVRLVAENLGCCVLRKGAVDIVSDGQKVLECGDPATPRRCGGQGDLLSGAIPVFAHWASLRWPEAANNPRTKLLHGALAATKFIRFLGRQTFSSIGRSMTASDMIAQIAPTLKSL